MKISFNLGESGKRRVLVNLLIMLFIALFFGVDQLPLAIAIIVGFLAVEFLLFKLLRWYWGADPKRFPWNISDDKW